MGLGPPVCQHCQVLAHFTWEKYWHCQYCGETKITDAAGFNPDRYRELERNERLFTFTKGIDTNGID